MGKEEESIDIISPEMIAFIAYNIGVYESVQKFGNLITSGKITDGSDVPKIAQLLSETRAFYDAEMIAQLINTMLRSYHHQSSPNKPIIEKVTALDVSHVMKQLKTTGIPLPS